MYPEDIETYCKFPSKSHAGYDFILRNYTDKDYDQWIEAARFCRLAYMDVTVLESIAAMTQADIMIAEEGIIQNEFTQIAKRRQIWPAFG